MENSSGFSNRLYCGCQTSRTNSSEYYRFNETYWGYLPAGVLNIVTGFGLQAGAAMATSNCVAKLSFTGSTEIGGEVLHNAAENIIPVTTELDGKSPNIFFPSVADHDDDFVSKSIDGAVMFALNQA